MDEEGHAQFASIKNLAHRARVTIEECEAAVKCLEGPDPDSSDPENDGRRLERVAGGWIVLNAHKYRNIVTRAAAQEATRARVARHREKKRSNARVTPVTNAVTRNDSVMQSEAYTETRAEAEQKHIQEQKQDHTQRHCEYSQPISSSKNDDGPLAEECDKILESLNARVRRPGPFRFADETHP